MAHFWNFQPASVFCVGHCWLLGPVLVKDSRVFGRAGAGVGVGGHCGNQCDEWGGLGEIKLRKFKQKPTGFSLMGLLGVLNMLHRTGVST